MSLRILSLILGLFVLGVASTLVSNSLGGGAITFWCLLLAPSVGYIRYSLKKIPANPPQKGAVTCFGKLTDEVLSGGWHFFPGNPFVWDFIALDPTKVTTTLNIKASTPDNVPLDIEVNLVYQLDPKNYRQFLNSGGKDRVAEILKDTIHERVREWSTSMHEGPQSWKEARQAREDAVAVIAKALLGNEIGIDNEKLPLSALLKFYDCPQRKPYPSKKDTSEAVIWGLNWEKLEAEILKRTPAEQDKLKGDVEARLEIIKGLMRGTAEQIDPSLGIVIKKIGLGDIKPPAKIEDAASLESLEEMKQAADKKTHERIEAMIKLGATFTEARDLIQVQPGSVKKEIKETKEDKRFSIDPDTVTVIGAVIGPIIDKWLNKDERHEKSSGTTPTPTP